MRIFKYLLHSVSVLLRGLEHEKALAEPIDDLSVVSCYVYEG